MSNTTCNHCQHYTFGAGRCREKEELLYVENNGIGCSSFEPCKVLSVKQPWSYLICAGIKDIENRTWKTSYRGRVLIHSASASWSWHKVLNYITKPMQEVFVKMGYTGTWLRNLQTSAIIGSVEIVDCVQNDPSIWAEHPFVEERSYYEQQVDVKPIYNWKLANPVLFDKPVTGVKGKLGLWNYNGNDYGRSKFQRL